MDESITERSWIVAAKELIWSDLDGEVVILNLRDGIYYGLDPVGAAIWQLVQEPRTVLQIRDCLLQEYDVEPDVCLQDVLALLADLAARQIVEARSAFPA